MLWPPAQVSGWWSYLAWRRAATAACLVSPWCLGHSTASPATTCTATPCWHSLPGAPPRWTDWGKLQCCCDLLMTSLTCPILQVRPPWRSALGLHHLATLQAAGRHSAGALCPVGGPGPGQPATCGPHPGQWVIMSYWPGIHRPSVFIHHSWSIHYLSSFIIHHPPIIHPSSIHHSSIILDYEFPPGGRQVTHHQLLTWHPIFIHYSSSFIILHPSSSNHPGL